MRSFFEACLKPFTKGSPRGRALVPHARSLQVRRLCVSVTMRNALIHEGALAWLQPSHKDVCQTLSVRVTGRPQWLSPRHFRLFETCGAVPLPCSDNAVSFVEGRVVDGETPRYLYVVQCLRAYIQSDPKHADSTSRFHLRQIFNKLWSRWVKKLM